MTGTRPPGARAASPVALRKLAGASQRIAEPDPEGPRTTQLTLGMARAVSCPRRWRPAPALLERWIRSFIPVLQRRMRQSHRWTPEYLETLNCRG